MWYLLGFCERCSWNLTYCRKKNIDLVNTSKYFFETLSSFWTLKKGSVCEDGRFVKETYQKYKINENCLQGFVYSTLSAVLSVRHSHAFISHPNIEDFITQPHFANHSPAYAFQLSKLMVEPIRKSKQNKREPGANAFLCYLPCQIFYHVVVVKEGCTQARHMHH